MKDLLKLSALRIEVIDIEGVKVRLRELSAVDMMEYQALAKTSRVEAMTFQIRRCVINEDGTEALTQDEASQLVHGSGRVLGAIVSALTAHIKDVDSGKVEAPIVGSSST